MKGGYVMINLTSSRLFKEINEAMTLDKPYLIYGDDIPYFADSITYDSDTTTYTIAKGGQLIVIDSENNITKTGDKDGALLSSIVDDAGNQRFIEGDLTPETISGMTFTYSKYSLSGTHLMFVLAGTIADTTVIADNTQLVIFDLPDYIKNKIIPIIGSTVIYKQMELIASDYSRTTLNCRLLKTTNMDIRVAANFTAAKDYYFRLQIDLLIDTE